MLADRDEHRLWCLKPPLPVYIECGDRAAACVSDRCELFQDSEDAGEGEGEGE